MIVYEYEHNYIVCCITGIAYKGIRYIMESHMTKSDCYVHDMTVICSYIKVVSSSVLYM